MTYYLNKNLPTRKNGQPEHEMQVQIVNYLKSHPSHPLFTATVGGVRLAAHTAMKMRAAGYSKGTPDLLIFEPRGQYHGLALEVKTEKGRPSEEQKKWIADLNERGYCAKITRGYKETVETIKNYLDGNHLGNP
jgi:hypothetical protein